MKTAGRFVTGRMGQRTWKVISLVALLGAVQPGLPTPKEQVQLALAVLVLELQFRLIIFPPCMSELVSSEHRAHLVDTIYPMEVTDLEPVD
jgi:hypothetical protein